jgi:hypothetical protein
MINQNKQIIEKYNQEFLSLSLLSLSKMENNLNKTKINSYDSYSKNASKNPFDEEQNEIESILSQDREIDQEGKRRGLSVVSLIGDSASSHNCMSEAAAAMVKFCSHHREACNRLADEEDSSTLDESEKGGLSNERDQAPSMIRITAEVVDSTLLASLLQVLYTMYTYIYILI